MYIRHPNRDRDEFIANNIDIFIDLYIQDKETEWVRVEDREDVYKQLDFAVFCDDIVIEKMWECYLDHTWDMFYSRYISRMLMLEEWKMERNLKE